MRKNKTYYLISPHGDLPNKSNVTDVATRLYFSLDLLLEDAYLLGDPLNMKVYKISDGKITEVVFTKTLRNKIYANCIAAEKARKTVKKMYSR